MSYFRMIAGILVPVLARSVLTMEIGVEHADKETEATPNLMKWKLY